MQGKRGQLVAFHALACLAMALQFACTDTVVSAFPTPHTTLRWGGHRAETWHVLHWRAPRETIRLIDIAS